MWPAAGDQFKEDSARERRWRSSFFNWFYFAINIGSLVRQQQQQQREG
jgi:dipeptide/tripeptide permease